MQPKGKGFYIWKIPNCEGGDISKIAFEAHKAGLTHVLVKIANGIYDYNYDIGLKKDLVAPLANELLKFNIKTWGWHYVFGDLPKDEAKAAIRQIQKMPLEGYVIDAESEYKGKYTPCRIFMSELRAALPDFPVALSSFRYPKYHMDLPWADFLSKSNYNMPQVYWEQAHNPSEQLERSLKEFQTVVSPFRSIVPTGSAYGANKWNPTIADITEFMNKALTLGLSGINFWSWDYCRRSLPALWETISAFNWPSAPNPEKDIIEVLINSLNTKDIDKLLSLYKTDAVHITAKRTIQGQSALRNWYGQIIQNDFKEAIFQITEISFSETTRQFSWKASLPGGKANLGSDTIGLSAGKILYHFSTMSG